MKTLITIFLLVSIQAFALPPIVRNYFTTNQTINLTTNNAGTLTNLHVIGTITVTNASITYTLNTDGSTNAYIRFTNGVVAGGYTGIVTNDCVTTTNRLFFTNGVLMNKTSLP